MEVILLTDVKDIGKKGQKVNVSDGYARNFLLPKKLAKKVTAAALNEIKTKEDAENFRKAEELKKAKEVAAAITGKTVKIKANIGENGKLFGSVTTKDVAAAAKEQYGIDLDKRKYEMDDIKNPGTYGCKVKLHPQVAADFYVTVG